MAKHTWTYNYRIKWDKATILAIDIVTYYSLIRSGLTDRKLCSNIFTWCSTNESIIYDACDVTLSVYPHRVSLKNMSVHGGNRTYDLWNTSPILCQLSYAVTSVRVCDSMRVSQRTFRLFGVLMLNKSISGIWSIHKENE